MFKQGFHALIPKPLIAIFNDRELELLISGLPEIDLDDLQANTEYTGFTAASAVIQLFWEVVREFDREDLARFLQFCTGTTKVQTPHPPDTVRNHPRTTFRSPRKTNHCLSLTSDQYNILTALPMMVRRWRLIALFSYSI
jgi:hypothetical protein